MSRSWFILGIASVVTFITCVSPRWNRPEPWAVGSTPTSADTGRRSVVPRPLMRMPSLVMRRRTSFLVSDRTASRISFSWPASSPGASAVPASSAMVASATSSMAALRSAFWAIVTAPPSLSVATRSTAVNTSGAYSTTGVNSIGVIGPLVAITLATSCRCRAIDSLIHCFDVSRPPARTASSTLGPPSS